MKGGTYLPSLLFLAAVITTSSFQPPIWTSLSPGGVRWSCVVAPPRGRGGVSMLLWRRQQQNSDRGCEERPHPSTAKATTGVNSVLRPQPLPPPPCPKPVESETVQTKRGGKKVTLRELRLEDLPELMALVEREFVNSPRTLFDQFEAWSLRQNIYWGFRMRLSYPDPLDHKVFVLEQGTVLFAMVEISQQPTTGVPPSLIPLPLFAKNLYQAWGFFLRPYISNLLVDSRARRRGYAQVLINRCEEHARSSLGSTCVYLHADVGYLPAVRLYTKLGYETVRDDPAFVKKLGMTQLRWFKKTLA